MAMNQAVRKEFVRQAKRATAGLKDSHVMVGIYDEGDEARWEFMLQVGYCLLHDKPLIIIAPTGTPIPEKLRSAASVVETFRPEDPQSLNLATKRALSALEIEAVH
jgi:hypothetical protein